MKRGILGLVIAVVVSVWVVCATARPASAQPATGGANLHTPAVFVVTLDGRIGWDMTPDLLVSLMLGADRTFGDLVPVVDAGPNDIDMVVHQDAWHHHVLVLRVNLGFDDRATHLNLHEYLAKFKQVLSDEMNLRNRRVVLWVQRADDLGAMLVEGAPEVIVLPGASSSVSPEFVERFTAEGGAPPEAADLSGLTSCTTTEEMCEAIGLPADTEILVGGALQTIQRWVDFRDQTLEIAQAAVGKDWDEYERVMNNPDEPAFRKSQARRDISNELRTAHQRIMRFDDLAEHPVFVPLREEILEKMRILSETPAPRAK